MSETLDSAKCCVLVFVWDINGELEGYIKGGVLQDIVEPGSSLMACVCKGSLLTAWCRRWLGVMYRQMERVNISAKVSYLFENMRLCS